MVEEADASEGHRDAVLVAGIDDMVVTNGTSCLCDIFYTALVCTFDVVAEGEERIATKTHFCVLCQPGCLLCQHGCAIRIFDQ